MKLKSGELLKALMASKRVSYGDLAQAVGKSKGFISHLTAEREKSCRPQTAEAIAFWLGVPVEVLFEPKAPTSTSRLANSNRKAA